MTDQELFFKIIFPLKQDKGGYPPVNREALWAKRLPNGSFAIDSIPFYVIGISPEDEVKAKYINGELHFSELLVKSAISTFHLILSDHAISVDIRNKIESLHCRSEYNAQIGLVAVEIPETTEISPFLNFIMAAKRDGILDFEESALRHLVQ